MMNRARGKSRTSAIVSVMAAALAITISSAAWAQDSQRYDNNTQNQRNTYANYNRTGLPAGTVIPVRLDNSLSSKEASRGDKFTATVIRGSDDAGLPEGTRIEGTVREANPSSDGRPGSLDVDFQRIMYPEGGTQAITASLYSLSGKTLNRADGRLVATADKGKDRLKFIGIGAGAGLLIGTLTKQNSILSALLGAGAGYLYNEVGNKPKPGDVNLKEGQEFGVRLDRQLAFNSQVRGYYRKGGVSQGSDTGDRGNSSAYADQVRVMVDGRPIRFSSSNRPYIRNGAVFVPLAAMGNELNFDYRYDSRSRTIYSRGDDVRATLGSRNATVGGQRRTMPTAAEQRNGVTFVPLQFISWAADRTVGWDEASGTVNITSDNRP